MWGCCQIHLIWITLNLHSHCYFEQKALYILFQHFISLPLRRQLLCEYLILVFGVVNILVDISFELHLLNIPKVSHLQNTCFLDFRYPIDILLWDILDEDSYLDIKSLVHYLEFHDIFCLLLHQISVITAIKVASVDKNFSLCFYYSTYSMHFQCLKAIILMYSS